MTRVSVEVPARLHLGMLDVSAENGRRFGGVGVSVQRPAVRLEAVASDGLSAEGADADRALVFARRFRDALGLPGGAHLRVLEAIPPHVGLGSGTKLALAVAAALTALDGRAPDPREMARATGRGVRSAVGLWTFALGGLVVEGGVGSAGGAAPLVARHPMPEEWRCVLVIPSAEPGMSGPAEEAAFRRLAPASAQAPLVAQTVLTSLLPALVDDDLDEFGAALTRMQRLVGEAFRDVQGGCFHPLAGGLVDALLAHGAAGAGQSSWGPAVYGFVRGDQEGRMLAGHMEEELAGRGQVELVGFDNNGARVERRCDCS
ncbi:MAG: GHMP kinase [Solirubrobacterales bacterium]|nr:GHMP kinase [Solirubrobacterales bacterium]